MVENLRAQMPNVDFIDRTNDGFTTTDVLQGAYKDKVFGFSTHRFFPHTHFKPLEAEELKSADQIILSVGGNNFREFIQHALQIQNVASRKQYIETEYPVVFEKMRNEYKSILRAIAAKNPTANIILMTQYYPALNQKTLLGTSIYEFMKELGTIRNAGDEQDTIVDVMKDTYSDIIKFISTDKLLAKRKISIVDVTSSLNPHDSNNFVGQIEPSDQGGKKIATMLGYVVHQSKTTVNKIYRFSPSFLEASASDKARHVYHCDVMPNATFNPVPPYILKRNFNWKLATLKGIAGVSAMVALPVLLGVTSLLWLSVAYMLGALLAWKVAKLLQIGELRSEAQIYAFPMTKKLSPSNKAMERFGFEAAKRWLPYWKSCLPFSGAYCNEDFNKGYMKGFIKVTTKYHAKKTVAQIRDNNSSDEFRSAFGIDGKRATSKPR